jgi:antitoxin ParD1/3/4
MNVSLTPQMVKFVEEQVASGDYQSASEVVRSGLRLLQEQKRERQVKLEALRREIAVGIAQADRGELVPLDVDEIKAEGRRRLAAGEGAEQLETARG